MSDEHLDMLDIFVAAFERGNIEFRCPECGLRIIDDVDVKEILTAEATHECLGCRMNLDLKNVKVFPVAPNSEN